MAANACTFTARIAYVWQGALNESGAKLNVEVIVWLCAGPRGDDYELCFTVASEHIDALTRALPPQHWQYRQIGKLREVPGAIVTRAGNVMEFSHSGFDHFAS